MTVLFHSGGMNKLLNRVAILFLLFFELAHPSAD